ncbi:MAG: alkaline phosphatase family protein [Pirellulales bacterium]|nr:alkaline phosphatase family protein [Pirellulales bacterium]
MFKPLILLSVPALREIDLPAMPKLQELMAGGGIASLTPGFPCVTCPVQAAMTTGRRPDRHGVVANGFYDRDKRRVEMWTAANDFIKQPQLWDLLSHHDGGLKSAVWFPLHAKGCEADYVCTPAPIHNPDGTESLWCYTRPTDYYGELRDRLGHFPLKNYWGPLAGLPSSRWIVDSALDAAKRWRPDFFYIYLQHLDYAAQRSGPDGPDAERAIAEFDALVERLAEGMREAYGQPPLWIVAGEYAITPVNHVCYPNRALREAGLLAVRDEEDGEHLDFENSRAFAMVDHQFSHVFVADGDQKTAERVAELFRNRPGIAEVLLGAQRGRYNLEHPRSGEVVLISTPESWQAYYWWLDDGRAPKFARTVDIHRKPGYDPVELCFDAATKSIPLDATSIKGSHGAPAVDPAQRTVLLTSDPTMLGGLEAADADVFDIVLKHFGLQ